MGAFTIENIVAGHPRKLWAKFKESSGIEEEEFFRHFGGNKKGFAIGIGDVEVFEDPIDQKSYNPRFVPPQSFGYIDAHWRFGK